MSGRFSGKRFVVTGGTRGIGRAIVEAAVAEGARVVFCGRKESAGTAAEIIAGLDGRHDGRADFVPADVAIESEVENLFDQTVEHLDGVDVVINNAGIQRAGLIVETSLASWNEVIATNLRGAFLVCRRAVDEFIGSATAGRIVNVSSVAASGLVGGASYAASKAGLVSLTRSIAKEYGRRQITCNAVAPGFVETEMLASFEGQARKQRQELGLGGRFATVGDVTLAVLFLASEDASFVTGEVLHVADGTRDVPTFRTSK